LFQLYPVEEILQCYNGRTINGPRLVAKLQANNTSWASIWWRKHWG